MVFWETYPLYSFFKSLLISDIFVSQIFSKAEIQSPSETETIILKKNECKENELSEIRLFLKKYFKKTFLHPYLDIPENVLLNTHDILIIIKFNNVIVGCIRYHFIGIFLNYREGKKYEEKIFCVDCFCIHPDWRRKGIGDYLLTKLHQIVNKNNVPYSIFLKEGYKLNIVHQPFYSGIYVYKKLQKNNINDKYFVSSLTINQAYKIMDLFLEIYPNTFIIRNRLQENQYWKLFKKGNYMIMCCFQDTYQYILEEKKEKEDQRKKSMCWCTGWFETPNIPDEIHKKAVDSLVDSMNKLFDYVWMDKQFIRNSNDWIPDGPFYWYSYQWATSIKINKSYCIIN